MNKGLEALERVKKFSVLLDSEKDIVKDLVEIIPNTLNAIEKELKVLEEHEEILSDYNLTLANFREACLFYAWLKSEKLNFDNGAKKLKALEIIKEKNVNAYGIKHSKDVYDYNLTYASNGKEQLTQEEYDLLKEVLL